MGFRSDQLVVWFMIILFSPTGSFANDEGNALNDFKIGLQDPGGVLDTWDPTLLNPCSWFHITCDGNNSVTRIQLGNYGLSGPLTAGLGSLKNLQYLELYQNHFTGYIPVQLGNLTNLLSLDLYSNGLKGRIPTELGNLRNLRTLQLYNNHLSGRPPVEALAQLWRTLKTFKIFPGNKNLCNPFTNPKCVPNCKKCF